MTMIKPALILLRVNCRLVLPVWRFCCRHPTTTVAAARMKAHRDICMVLIAASKPYKVVRRSRRTEERERGRCVEFC